MVSKAGLRVQQEISGGTLVVRTISRCSVYYKVYLQCFKVLHFDLYIHCYVLYDGNKHNLTWVDGRWKFSEVIFCMSYGGCISASEHSSIDSVLRSIILAVNQYDVVYDESKHNLTWIDGRWDVR